MHTKNFATNEAHAGELATVLGYHVRTLVPDVMNIVLIVLLLGLLKYTFMCDRQVLSRARRGKGKRGETEEKGRGLAQFDYQTNYCSIYMNIYTSLSRLDCVMV